MNKDQGRAPRIGIIGGRGRFGEWLRGLFEKNGYEVTIADVGTSMTNREVARSADIVCVSVPIGVTLEVLKEIAPELGADKLVVDLTSVKTHLVPVLKAMQCEVLSLHPMFAPSLRSYVGQTCAVCRIRSGHQAGYIEALFSREGVSLVEMTPDEHDRMMAVIQGLTHFQALAAAHCMMQMGFDPQSSLTVSSPVYRLRMLMIGRILAQDPNLYAEIQVLNPYVKEVLKELGKSSALLEGKISEADVAGFVAECTRIRETFGSFPDRALQESNQVIENLRGT